VNEIEKGDVGGTHVLVRDGIIDDGTVAVVVVAVAGDGTQL
jgi:hypothetical protein